MKVVQNDVTTRNTKGVVMLISVGNNEFITHDTKSIYTIITALLLLRTLVEYKSFVDDVG